MGVGSVKVGASFYCAGERLTARTHLPIWVQLLNIRVVEKF